MDPRIENLQSTTFQGWRFTRKKLAEIQETVQLLPNLSRHELAQTLCVQHGWQTAKGRNREAFALRLLKDLEQAGILSLPAPRTPGRGPQKALKPGPRTAPQPAVEGPLASLVPLQLQVVTEPEQVGEWNEWVQRYHPLGYRQPIGPSLRYFLLDRHGRKLGCLLFSYATRNVACRDAWIGWRGRAHRKHLRLLLGHPRYLLFPWVRVKCLASKALGQAVRQLPADWERRHGERPVLVQTFVDPQRHKGTCYRAAGWQLVGRTPGSPAKGSRPARTPKDVYVRPLHRDWRRILHEGPPPPPRRRGRPREQAAAGERFVQLWRNIIGGVERVAREHDAEWVRRRRVLNTLLVVLFVFRLVFAPDRRGYATVAADLWEQCRRLGLELPRPEPVSAAALCKARAKVGAGVFRKIHRAVLEQAGPQGGLWKGHRLFAVDGSKLNLPRALLRAGYATPSPAAHYPQGLLSCLYQLRTRLPFDCELHAHGNERRAALRHFSALAAGDIVVYDRGYYSFQLLRAHLRRGLHSVFRLQRNANPVFDAFIAADCAERTVDVAPPRGTPGPPCRVRLVRYTAGGTTFFLATTLLDRKRYRRQDLAKLYHARWGIEEYYKTAKKDLRLEQFRGRSERLVKQELYANCTLIALTRLFANRSEGDARAAPDGHGRPGQQANFRHALHTVARHVEGLFLRQAALVRDTVQHILDGLAVCRPRRRPRRSYPRLSRKPVNKWRKRKAAATPA